MPFSEKMKFNRLIANNLFIPDDSYLQSFFQLFSTLFGLIFRRLCSPVIPAAFYEPYRGKGMEMSMQVPAQGVMLHQAILAVLDAFASA